MDAPEYVQYLSAFKSEEQLIISSCVKTEEGSWYLQQPLVILNSRAPLAKIGDAVFRALSDSGTGLREPPNPIELDDTMRRLFKAAGVQTFARFQESILHCAVGQNSKAIEITPTHIDAAHSVHFLLQRRIFLEVTASPEQLGAAFLQGFAASTSVYM